MASDTFTSSLGVILMGTGNDNNTWGTNCNSFAFQILEDAIANQLLISTTGGTTDLSGTPPPAAASQARYAQIQINGALTSNVTLIVPNLPKVYQIFNNTTGNFVVTVYPAGESGNATNVPQGVWRTYFCDGANNIIRSDKELIGSYVHHSNTSGSLAGHLRCQGQSLATANYPDLFAAIGYTYGGSGANFTLPQLEDTGRYLRSYTSGLTAGATQANQVGPHTHTITDPGHTHTVNDSGHVHAITDNGHTHGFSTSFDIAGSTATSITYGGGSGPISVPSSPAGISIASAATGISVNNHTTGITNQSATTGITVNSNGTTETRPETMITYTYIRY